MNIAASSLAFLIQAGLQVTPNGTTLLKQWGIFDELASHANSPVTLSVHRYDGTKLLAHEPDLQEADARPLPGAVLGFASRRPPAFHDRQMPESLGIVILLDARAVSVNFEAAKVTLQDSRTVEGGCGSTVGRSLEQHPATVRRS